MCVSLKKNQPYGGRALKHIQPISRGTRFPRVPPPLKNERRMSFARVRKVCI